MGRSPLSPEARQRIRDRLLDAAVQVFETRGYLDARIEEIAQAAKVSVGTIYNYFPGKADLILEIHHRRLQAALQQVEALVQDEGTFCEKVRLYLAQFVSFSESSREFLEALRNSSQILREAARASEDRVRQVHEVLDRLVEAVSRLMSQGIAEGVLRPEDPRDLAQCLLGMARSLAMSRVRRSQGLEDLPGMVLNLFLYGAAPGEGCPGTTQRP